MFITYRIIIFSFKKQVQPAGASVSEEKEKQIVEGAVGTELGGWTSAGE